MYLLPAHRLPLLQHLHRTFLRPPPLPTMEQEEQGVSQVAYTRLINNTHSILLSRR